MADMPQGAVARCPAVLVTAPASGQGKTTITAALARLHARQGRRVRVFKCGPDFLDPFWHELASGAPVYQLDLWMTGEADCRARLHAAAQEADLIIVEGVMGLYDGEPSAADLAQRLGLPVLAVIDAGAMAGTFGAVAYGLQHYRAGLRWAGVLANRVGSARHAGMLQASLQNSAHWLGALLRNPALTLPERHLGLVAATELGDAMARLDAAADALAATPLGQMDAVQLGAFRTLGVDSENAPQRDQFLPDSQPHSGAMGQEAGKEWAAAAHSQPTIPKSERLQAWAVEFPAPTVRPVAPWLAGRTVAVARDAAFCFVYAANVQTLEQLGARVVFFSPLADAALPPCDAVWLPGGYPELHAAQLHANQPLRADLHAHLQAGKPLWAECGGMVALMDSIRQPDGRVQPLWGLLPGEVTLHTRLAALGPQQLAWQGHCLRGHTFHYSTCSSSALEVTRTAAPGAEARADVGEALYRHGSIHASYFHAWFALAPQAVALLFGAAQEECVADAEKAACP